MYKTRSLKQMKAQRTNWQKGLITSAKNNIRRTIDDAIEGKNNIIPGQGITANLIEAKIALEAALDRWPEKPKGGTR